MARLRAHMDALLADARAGEKKVYGLKGGARAYFFSLLCERSPRPLLIVTPTAREAENLYRDVAFFLGEKEPASPLETRLHLFPSWEILPFENLSPHPENLAARLEGLYYLLCGRSPILISTPAALLQRVLPREALAKSYLYLVAGDEIALDDLRQRLTLSGFHHVPLVEERGDFSVRGGIVDVFPPGYARPLRLEFLGDKIETIREFEPATQRSLRDHREILLLPMREFTVTGENARAAERDIERRAADLDVPRKVRNSLLEALRAGIPFVGMEWLVPFFYPALGSVFSYLPADAIVCLDHAAQVEAELERFSKLVWQRAAKAQEEQRLIPAVESLYLSEAEWRAGLAEHGQILSDPLELASFKSGTAAGTLSVKSYLNTDLHPEIATLQGKEPSLAPLVSRLNEWQQETVFFVASSPAEATRLKELLAHYGLEMPLLEAAAPLRALEQNRRAIVHGGLTQGFRLPEENLVVITSDEIFGTHKRQRAPARRAHPSHFITSLSELKQEDYVVHLDHGIGIYRGLKFLQVGGVEGEFLHLEYAGGDRLYLPVDRINLVQKYIGGDGAQPALDRLGGSAWERVKARTRKSVLEIAQELVDLYALREVQGGHALPPPDQHYREFEAAFEFEETPDQERAIAETLRDLQSPKPADRLICGDVGYGKTEVALRAVFLAVMGGKQVAVLTPTTILAQQHFQTFSRRLRGYPFRIEMLSRFLSPAQTQDVLAGLANGTVDIVIGTHRLLQKDVQFRDLGLAVIDEEHRFGVTHKERLKKLRSQVDVISLTATPIPRTLHMALVGIRDLSIIESPPPDRLAIRTYIAKYDEGVIRDAILRELSRGGQVFFLHNRVETIARMAQRVADLVPEARIAVAHGQMKPRDLEKVMMDFLENRTQVLVCSAIIESGLDFPNANTIIINRAERFGLAQLYQLRGRVGRSHHRAYAYLLVPREGGLTRDAEKRLRALQELDELGGGFKLALHDLEIRGAGNLLGREQSGHITAVGFELYTRMMEEAILRLKGAPIKPAVEPEIKIGIPAYFPQSYIPDANQRLLFYKRLANLRDRAELHEIQEEIRDRYGPLPQLVKNLFRVMELRHVLKEAAVEQISFRDGAISLLFNPRSPVKAERLVGLVNRDHGRYRLSPDLRLSFAPRKPGWEGMISEVISLLQDLS
ncbi:MAG TPA: transcription-repair coupling factor [Candidatus Acidoferrales bacterium]|nr:transcription-repair coupling factor [Candidatus Acidoferrales bacterium]